MMMVDPQSETQKSETILVSHEKSVRASEIIRDFLYDENKVSHPYKELICGDCFPYFSTKVETFYTDIKSSLLEYKDSEKKELELRKNDQFNSKEHRPSLLPNRSSFADEFEDLNERLNHIGTLDCEVDTVTAKLDSTARVLHATLSELEKLPVSEGEIFYFYNHPLQAPAIYCNQCNVTDLESIAIRNKINRNLNTEGPTTNTGQLFARLGYAGSYLRLGFSAVGSINLGWSEVNGAWVNMASLLLSVRRDGLLPAELTFHLDQEEAHHAELCSTVGITAPRVATVHVLPLSGRVQLSLSISGDQPSIQYLCLQGGVLRDRHKFEVNPGTATIPLSVSGCLYLRAALLFAAGVVQTSFDVDRHHDAGSSGAQSKEIAELCSSCEHFHRYCQKAVPHEMSSSDVRSVTDWHACSSCGCASSMERGPCTRCIAWELVHALNPNSTGIAADCKWKKEGAQADLIDSLWHPACDCAVTLSDMDVLLLDLSCILKSLIHRIVR